VLQVHLPALLKTAPVGQHPNGEATPVTADPDFVHVQDSDYKLVTNWSPQTQAPFVSTE